MTGLGLDPHRRRPWEDLPAAMDLHAPVQYVKGIGGANVEFFADIFNVLNNQGAIRASTARIRAWSPHHGSTTPSGVTACSVGFAAIIRNPCRSRPRSYAP